MSLSAPQALMSLVKQLGREQENLAEAFDRRKAGAGGGNDRLLHGNYVQVRATLAPARLASPALLPFLQV